MSTEKLLVCYRLFHTIYFTLWICELNTTVTGHLCWESKRKGMSGMWKLTDSWMQVNYPWIHICVHDLDCIKHRTSFSYVLCRLLFKRRNTTKCVCNLINKIAAGLRSKISHSCDLIKVYPGHICLSYTSNKDPAFRLHHWGSLQRGLHFFLCVFLFIIFFPC